ncbi:hypothetical protein BDV33DRAFT_201267 [Aspergillus novoparasiticus]|uniref:Uncharacterized protein n=1 Tax=Aspergillus novoparasiticus TaxID=986946 RepID=A0A5N6F036_9EURO|nr:hypothetical protein BDV33DRAFT_201267 [Aspergillus novoparasiticus]
MSSQTQGPPPTENDTYKELAPQPPLTPTTDDNDTYRELTPQRLRHREDDGLQVSDRDCTLETSDRDCTLEVDQQAQEIHRKAVNGTHASGDIEADTLEKSHGQKRSRNCFKENGRVQKSRVCCTVTVVVVIIMIILLLLFLGA